jgi:hypothetical protein
MYDDGVDWRKQFIRMMKSKVSRKIEGEKEPAERNTETPDAAEEEPVEAAGI